MSGNGRPAVVLDLDDWGGCGCFTADAWVAEVSDG